MFYIEAFHLAADFHETHRSFHIHLDGALERLVELHRGRRVEHDRHVIADDLNVGRRHAQAGHGHVAGDWHQLVQHLRRIFTQAIKHLSRKKYHCKLKQTSFNARHHYPIPIGLTKIEPDRIINTDRINLISMYSIACVGSV